ncbi:hypothetical protein NDU88_003884 [Pleurodeles waltl]|uniref:ribonuclease H n=1 Tax=Pleurodeles waltl TaxID=8319 RepID=A0AAV7M8E6_PLEWA|nr:hypothetical protein NDU88_003884 [Pleurodeles waltl]
MAPGGAPAGPSGPLAFNMGAPAPLRPAPFMPFLPLGNVGSAPVSAPVAPETSAPGVSTPAASVFRPVTPSRPSATPKQSSLHPTPGSAPKLPVAPVDPTSDGSGDRRSSSTSADTMLMPRIEERLHSRRRALRLLEEQEYQQNLEEGEIEDSGEGLHGLDTSPEWDLSSPGEYTEEADTFHAVIRKAANFLELPLPVTEAKQNLLTEVLHPASTSADPLLPFNEVLLEPVLEVWKKPVSSSAVNRSVARRYRAAPADPGFLTRHPTPESLVVQASCSARSAPGSFPSVPSDRDSKKMDMQSKKVFSSCSMALKSTNATCILGRYIYALMDEITSTHTEVPQGLLNLVSDAQAAATQVIQSGLDTTDSVARAMGTAVVTRRQAWLRNSGFSSDLQSTLLDLPFDGDKLFGAKADSALERFKESRATAKSYFLIPKKDGRLRPILDLRILNWFLKQEKFKMLTLAKVLLALNKGDWMVSVDLQDAYFHIPILKSHKKYLRFVVVSQHYQFAVLPFDLTSAPRVFTKVMSVVAAELRKRGIAVLPYLDDWLIKAKSPELVLHHLQSTTQLLFDLGFSVNMPKSHLEPSQRLLFIGAVLDTTLNRAFPPPQRMQDIQALVPMFQS